MTDEPTDLDDARVSDTCHCDCCGKSFVLGDSDYVIVEVPYRGMPEMYDNKDTGQLALCEDCAKAVHDEYRNLCLEIGVDPCQP